MNDIARINLQTGVPEDKRYPWTDYSPTSDLDRWLIQRQELLKQAEEYWERKHQAEVEKQVEEQLNKEIETKVGDLLERKLDDLFKGFH